MALWFEFWVSISLYYLLKRPFPNVDIFDVVALLIGVSYCYRILCKHCVSLLDKLPVSDHKIYFARTFHARFFPTRHAFEYPVLYVGVDLDKLSSGNVFLWGKDSVFGIFNRIFAYNQSALFSVFADDYLGEVRLENSDDDSKPGVPIVQSIKEKLLWHIRRRKISTENLKQIELITTPRFFGYAFNPVSFYFCYDNNQELAVIVLEVNNTFGEKHLYVLSRNTGDDATIRKGYDLSFTFRRAFHVSPFNDREGFYQAFCRIPSKGKLDMRLVMYTELSESHNDEPGSIRLGKKKMVAVVSASSYPLSLTSLFCAMITYPLDVFLTMPRILKEAYKLQYQKRLGIFHRPNPIEGTVVKLAPNFIDRYAQQVTMKYLHELVAVCSEPISLTIHLPSFNESPIHIPIQVRNTNSFEEQNRAHKKIVLHLSNYTFFTNFLFDQSIYRALIVGYFEKAWECNDLSLLLDFFFNLTLRENNEDDYFKNKPYLIVWAAKIRRFYLRSVINGKDSGGLEAKKEFDRLIQKLSLNKSKDQEFTTAIVQDDVLFSETNMKIPIRNLLDANIKICDFKHIYMFSSHSSGSIKDLLSLVNDKLHLLPFPPRYFPNELIRHPIDKIVLTSSASKSDRLQHFLILLIGAMLYKLDAWFWQKTTDFIEGPHGNPFVVEKYIWEGVVDLIKRTSGNNSCENILDAWEVVFERKDDQLHLIPPVPLTNFPWRSREQSNHIKDFQYRLWSFMKTFREVVLINRNT